MGFLGSFNPAKIISNVIRNPVATVTQAVTTGGVSLVSPQVAKATSFIPETLFNPQLLLAAAPLAAGGAPMGFNVGQFLGGLGGILGQSQLPAFQTVGQIAGAFAPAFAQPMGQPPAQLPAPGGGMVPIARGTVMTKEIFDAAAKLLARLGIQPRSVSGFTSAVTRALTAIAALARRTPAGTIISILVGLGLAVQEANVLVSWWATKKLKRRRMNPANAKALRRAARRIRSFHRLCVHTDVVSRARGGVRRRRRTTIVLCPRCRRSPCQCE